MRVPTRLPHPCSMCTYMRAYTHAKTSHYTHDGRWAMWKRALFPLKRNFSASTHGFTHARASTHIRTYARTHAHARARARTHTHTHSCARYPPHHVHTHRCCPAWRRMTLQPCAYARARSARRAACMDLFTPHTDIHECQRCCCCRRRCQIVLLPSLRLLACGRARTHTQRPHT